MVSFMHIARNVKVTELNLYEDAILDACCHNIVADDELWYRAVEVSVMLLTCTQRSNPRSPWYIPFLVLNFFQLFSVVTL
jgi:TELO2-interacting protein 2